MSFRKPFSTPDDDPSKNKDPFAEFAPEPVKDTPPAPDRDWLNEFPDEKPPSPASGLARNWKRLNDNLKG